MSTPTPEEPQDSLAARERTLLADLDTVSGDALATGATGETLLGTLDEDLTLTWPTPEETNP